MISCTDFIYVYNELFKFLEARGGKKAVRDFWNHLSERFLGNLKELVEKHGIRGCWLYWTKVLNEEAADFTMELDEKNGVFSIVMNRCPSKSRLMENTRGKTYKDYCEHCDVIYRNVLEPLGYECLIDRSQCDRACCRIEVRRNSLFIHAPASNRAKSLDKERAVR